MIKAIRTSGVPSTVVSCAIYIVPTLNICTLSFWNWSIALCMCDTFYIHDDVSPRFPFGKCHCTVFDNEILPTTCPICIRVHLSWAQLTEPHTWRRSTMLPRNCHHILRSSYAPIRPLHAIKHDIYFVISLHGPDDEICRASWHISRSNIMQSRKWSLVWLGIWIDITMEWWVPSKVPHLGCIETHDRSLIRPQSLITHKSRIVAVGT